MNRLETLPPIIPIILCGGSGSRLWPLSREMFPKQLLSLVSETSLLQETVKRVQGFAGAPVLICNEAHRFLVSQQLLEVDIKASMILLEPIGRNTAPAVAVCAHAVLSECEEANEPILLVLPSDHIIGDVDGFRQAVSLGRSLAAEGALVTFGIQPQSAETGYGYVRAGAATAHEGSFNVVEFVEKPDLATAESYLAAGDYYWNSGMFMFRASEYLRVLAEAQPAMTNACREAYAFSKRDLDFVRLDKTHFEQSPADSIDYAVMEVAANVVVIPMDVNWSDVGSWSALHDIARKDDAGNAVLGDVMMEDTANSYIRAEQNMVATVGVEDLIIVETADAVLVANRNRVQDVKKIVASLKHNNRAERLLHKRVYRPWGSYEGIDQGDRHKVKRIRVNPGARLSLQKHARRAEHWVVVTGFAEVVVGDQVMNLEENQSTYIPAGTLHRLSNPTDQPLEIIEVQSGDYLGEDDIVRFEDDYGR